MNQSEIPTILNDWNFWKIYLETGIIREDLLKRLDKLYKLNEIVVVSGVRGCGKSTLLLQFGTNLIEKGVRKEDILIINPEDPRGENLDLELLNRVYEVYMSELEPKEKHYVVPDEVLVVDKLEERAKYYLTNISSLQSFNKIKNFMNLSLDSVERFSGYPSSVYLISFSRKFSYSLKGQIQNPKKVYSIDSGLRTAVGFFFSEDIGRIVENIAFLELSIRCEEIYYWKDYQQREVDFVIKEGQKVKQLIQVCYNTEDFNPKERESKALVKASDELKCNNLLVITWNYEAEEEFKGKKIRFVPMWKWLLEV